MCALGMGRDLPLECHLFKFLLWSGVSGHGGL
jgi:hypothetical protein